MKTRSHDGLLEFAAGEILMRVQTAGKKSDGRQFTIGL